MNTKLGAIGTALSFAAMGINMVAMLVNKADADKKQKEMINEAVNEKFRSYRHWERRA